MIVCLLLQQQILNGFILFSKKFGFEKDSDPVFFDSDKIKKYSTSINFLYGQLDAMQKKHSVLTPQNAALKYDKTLWTKNSATLMKFFFLGYAQGVLTPFFAKDKSAHILLLEPTLSPKDPNFAEWFKGYEAEMKKSEGPTPDEK